MNGENVEKEKIKIELEKAQQCLEWTKTLLFLDTNVDNAAKRRVKRGQVYDCNLGYGIGCDENKKRPCVILQYDSANISSSNTIVAPITHTESAVPVVVPIAEQKDSDGNITLDGNVLLGNVVCVSKARLGDYKGKLTSAEMKRVDEALAKSIGLKKYYDKLNNIIKDREEYIKKLKQKIADQDKEIERLKGQSV